MVRKAIDIEVGDDRTMSASSDTAAAERREVRRMRQLSEIVTLIESGAIAKAVDLTHLHLAEFPDDASIVEPRSETRAPTGATDGQ